MTSELLPPNPTESIRSRRRTTQWNLVSTYATVATAMLSGVVLVPLYLRYISLETYGLWLATGNVLAWVTAIDPGLSNVLQQRVAFAYGRGDTGSVGSLIAAGSVLACGVAVLALAIGWLIGGHILGWLSAQSAHDGTQLIRAFYISVAGAAISIFAFSIAAVNEGLQGSLGVGAINLAASLAGIGVSIVLIFDGYGVIAIASAMLVRGIAYLIGHGIYLAMRLSRERVRMLLRTQEIRSLTGLSTATFLGRAGGMLSTQIDLFLVAHLLGPEAVTMLSITRKSAEVNVMLVERPSVAFMPAVSHLSGSRDPASARCVLHRLMFLVLWFVGLLTGGMAAFNDDFVRLWVGSHLFAGAAVTIAICAAFALRVLSNSMSNLIFAMGDIRRSSLVGFLQSLVFAALLFGFIRAWGILGVPLASAVSLALVSIGYYSRAFATRIGYTRADVAIVAREILVVAALSASLAIIGLRLGAATWSMFLLDVVVFATCYTFGLLLLSPAFRAQALAIAGQLGWARHSGAEKV